MPLAAKQHGLCFLDVQCLVQLFFFSYTMVSRTHNPVLASYLFRSKGPWIACSNLEKQSADNTANSREVQRTLAL